MSNSSHWQTACRIDDLVPNSGVCALINGQQVAIFHVPSRTPSVYAVDNFDPIGGANVLSRGIVGDVQGELVVASPLYKQHFSLTTGRCLEQDVAVHVWPVEVCDTVVRVQQPRVLAAVSNC